jgi:hypothetical protein
MANITSYLSTLRGTNDGKTIRNAIADITEAVNTDNNSVIGLLGGLNPVEIAAAAVTATTKAGEAAGSADDAMDSQVVATAQAGIATTKAAEALASKNAAAASEVNSAASEQAAAGSEAVAITKAGESAVSAAAALALEQAAAEHEATALGYKDATLAAVGGATDLAEIIEARKGKVTIGEKISEIDSQLADTTVKTNANTSKITNLESYIGYTDPEIFGVEVDMVNKTFTRLAGAVGKTAGANFDSIKAFGGRRRCNLTDNGEVLAYYGETGYTETGALTQQIIKNGVTYPIGTAVQVMVEQPKFYYKTVPLLLEKIEFKELNTLTVTAGSTADGNITINLDGVPFTVAILATDNTPTLVATKIRAATYAGWTTGGTTTAVTFTATVAGTRTTATFAGGTTGATATVAKTQPGYIGKGFHNRKSRYYISDAMKAGFKLHPAFIVNGVEKDVIYLPAFDGSIFDVSASTYILDDAQIADFTVTTGDKLCSIANAKPASGLTQQLTRENARKLAQNRGTGWQQAYAATVACSQMLFLIEYASFNSQTAIGMGNVGKTDNGTTNMAENTGATTSLGNSSGAVTNGNGVNIISYRGEENLWGNVWAFVDGLNIYAYGENSIYIADNGFADGIGTTPYKDAGITLAKKDGFSSAFVYNKDFDWLFLTSDVAGDSALPVGDLVYQDSQVSMWLVPTIGGAWLHSLNAGVFSMRNTNSSPERSRFINSRLVYVG